MFEFRDLFQWDRFITPTIIKTFYWLVIALIALFGISGIFSGLAAMAISPFGGFILLLSSIASVIVGVIFSRIAAEFILIVFRINEHLGAIRDQGQGQGHWSSAAAVSPHPEEPRACAASRRMGRCVERSSFEARQAAAPQDEDGTNVSTY